MVRSPKTQLELARWQAEIALVPEGSFELKIPFHVLCGEAVDVARFHAKYWEGIEDAHGNVLRPGLEQAEGKGNAKKKDFSAATGDEILSLQVAAQESQTAYLLSVEQLPDSPFERGRFVLGEIVSTLEWLFDDGIEDEKDKKLAALGQAHAEDVQSADGLASALDDFAALAEEHRDDLHGLGGFDAAQLDEARAIARALRLRPATALVQTPKAREALQLRNRVLVLLVGRMNRVRAAARFVFRSFPEIAREATSAYERRRRAESRRAKGKAEREGEPRTGG